MNNWIQTEFIRRIKRNAWAFGITFLVSLLLSSFYPRARDFVSWQVQYQLCNAAAQGQTTRVKTLLLLGANANGFNTTFIPLHYAARYGQTESARLLLDAGADINRIGLSRQTALMEAASAGNPGTVRLLLARGAPLYKVDSNGKSALGWATVTENSAGNRDQVVNLLNAAGAK